MDGATLLDLLTRSATSDRQIEMMPADVVRFALVYAAPPALDAERTRLSSLLGTGNFSLSALESDPALALSRVLLLQFPDVRRTLSERALYDIAAALTDRLGLAGCEPDIGARIFTEPDPRTQPILSPETSIVGLWCSSHAAVPDDRGWALNAICAPQAWAISSARGAGVLVGQPDTGVAQHDELEAGALNLAKAANILEGGPPTDPISAGMFNPGHGTATASAVASRNVGIIVGAAPGAQVVPVRCVNSVVLFDAAPVAAAVNHARAAGCDVVTMSLGGIFSTPLRAAIEDAVNAGIVVLAAAGNCVGFVTYPASDPRVIAVAAVDQYDKPWRGSSSGSQVDVSAPGENVYVAVRRPGDSSYKEVGASQGTSFAVALTAGVAALWIAHHGKAQLKSLAAQRGITVSDLFRAALRQTARKPTAWNAKKFGAGVVDAAALLSLALETIPEPKSAPKPRGTLEVVSALAVEGRKIEDFDWSCHGAEASLLAAKAAICSRRTTIGFESVGRGVLQPSRELVATAPAILRNMLGDELPGRLRRSRAVGRRETETILKLAGTSGTDLESATGISTETAQQRLRSGHGRALVERLSGTLEGLAESDTEIANEQQEILKNVSTGLQKMAQSGVDARLSGGEHFALEALISLHNRPALRVRNDAIDMADPMLGDWNGTLFNNAELTGALKAVGRVNLDNVHVGTGWVVGPGLIATNRHVLEEIAEEFASPAGGSLWVLRDEVTVNFDETGLGDAKRFALTDVVSAGPDRINGMVNFHHLDMAVLAAETTNSVGTPLPKSLPLVNNADLVSHGSEMLICGFPARPGVNSLRDPNTGQVRDDVVTRLQKIFGYAYSVKYLSPGQIRSAPGTLEGDVRNWVFGHDATTLGGNSGSWALYLGDPMGVIGLHFGGGTLRSNYAHTMVGVRESGVWLKAGLAGTNWV